MEDVLTTRTVPVQNAELSTHTQGLRDRVGHHHMRYVVLVERSLEIAIEELINKQTISFLDEEWGTHA